MKYSYEYGAMVEWNVQGWTGLLVETNDPGPLLSTMTATSNYVLTDINPLNTKRRLFYLKIQFVPSSKRFSPRLQKPISLLYKWHKSLFIVT